MSINVIGKVIAERRAALKLTQTQLAERCGLSQPLIARIEGGTKADINLSSLRDFARGFGISGSELLAEIERMEQQS